MSELHDNVSRPSVSVKEEHMWIATLSKERVLNAALCQTREPK